MMAQGIAAAAGRGRLSSGIRNVAVVGILAGMVALPAPAAETGDVDGDGRLSIADIFHVLDALPSAEGALAGFEAHPCYEEGWRDGRLGAAIFLECLRRGVPGSFPNWVDAFPGSEETVEPSTLPEDPRVLIELVPAIAPGGASDRVELRVMLTALAPIRAFWLVLEAEDGLLRITPGEDSSGEPAPFSAGLWRRDWKILSGQDFRHDGGDLAVSATPQSYLITGSRYVVQFNLWDSVSHQAPGVYELIVEARLPKGTPAGTYVLRVLSASQVLLADGSTFAPEVEGSGTLQVEKDIEAGWDEGLPPLGFDFAERRVEGEIAFRFADSGGNPVPPDRPVAAGRQGETVRVRIQMRTEVPLNELRYRVGWEPSALLCGPERPQVLFRNPVDGEPYHPSLHPSGSDQNDCWSYGGASGVFLLAGSQNAPWDPNYRERPLEYFKPLDEWTDIVELSLVVGDAAAGGSDVPLTFVPYLMPETGEPRCYRFVPYTPDYLCGEESWRGHMDWRYDVRHENAFVRVLGDDPAAPPPDLGLHVSLGEDSTAPGETMLIPISIEAERSPEEIVIALEVDPEVLEVEAIEMDITLPLTGAVVTEDFQRGESLLNVEGVDEDGDAQIDRWFEGEPLFVFFRETPERFVLLHLGVSMDYVGPTLETLVWLRVRVREDAPGVETLLRPATVVYRFPDGREQEFLTGGKLVGPGADDRYSPAEVTGGRIRLEGRGFIRGNSNEEGGVDLSDAVYTLDYLFRGGPAPVCRDAADGNDDGAIDLTDAVFVLGALFLGGGPIPAPYPACGRDPTEDSLGCRTTRACFRP